MEEMEEMEVMEGGQLQPAWWGEGSWGPSQHSCPWCEAGLGLAG